MRTLKYGYLGEDDAHIGPRIFHGQRRENLAKRLLFPVTIAQILGLNGPTTTDKRAYKWTFHHTTTIPSLFRKGRHELSNQKPCVMSKMTSSRL